MQAFVRQMLCVQYILHTHTYIHIYYIQFEHWRHINFFFLPSFSSDFIKLNKHSISLNIIKGRTLILKAAQKVYDNNYIVLCNSMDVLYNHQSVVTDFHFTMIKKKILQSLCSVTVYILPRSSQISFITFVCSLSPSKTFFLCF